MKKKDVTTKGLFLNILWSLKRVYCYSKRYFICLCIDSILSGMTPIILLLIIQKVIDCIQYRTGDFRTVIIWMVFLSCFELLSTIFQIFTQLKIENYELQFDAYFQENILTKVSLLDCKDFERSKTYDLINRTQYDANAGILGSVKTLFSLVSSVISTISYMIIILKYNIAIFFIVIVLPIVRYLFEKKYNLLEYEVEKQNTEKLRKCSYISHILTNAEHFKEIKMFNLFNFFIRKYKNIKNICNIEFIKLHNKRAITYGIISLFELLVDFMITVFIIIQAFNHIISIGFFVLYNNSIDSLKGSVLSMFSQLSFLYKNSAMIEQIKEFFNIEEEDINKDGIVIGEINTIKFKGVSYQYQNQNEYVLKNINLEIESGKTYIIMGNNGSGKSTLMKIIMGIYNDYEGEILINNIDRRNINLDSYRNKVGVLFQDYIKFETSISDNIRYGKIDANYKKDDIDEVMGKVQLDDLILKKNQQLGYQFNEGLQLSIGQWQKIALGRTLVSDRDLYIFDEPNASIDLVSENAIFNTIAEDSKEKIKIVIVHRFNKIVESADFIITIDNGHIIEIGNHNELIKNKGLYYNLYKLQNDVVSDNADIKGGVKC